MKKINWLTTIALCVVLLNFAAGCSNVGLSGSVQADSSAGHSENAYGGGTGNPAGADNSTAAENVPAEFNIPSITIAVGERHAFSVRGWTANNPNARAFYVSENAVIGEKSGHDDLIILYNGSTYTIPVTVTAQKQAEAEVEVEEETRKDPVWMKQALEPNASVWADGVNAPAELESIWLEEEGSGFFNVLKTAYALTADEHAGKRSDANFCYGAAAANLVHWWEKATQGSTSYKLNGDYNTTGYMESSVYNMFLRKYNNGSGGDETQPLYDYFTEKTETKQTDSPRYVYTFGGDNAFDAFCKRMAWIYKSHGTAAITYHDGRISGKHIVNVWGYETDSSGKISYVWIGDSNMGNSNMKPLRNSRLYKCKITYGAGDAVYLHHRGVSNKLESMTAVFKELTEE